jgi:hypothetical protein
MPRYFFHIRDGRENTHVDTVGDELADDEAAWREAVASAGLTLRDLSRSLKVGSDWRLEVVDNQGSQLFVIRVQTSRGNRGPKPEPDPVSTVL